MGVSGLQPRMPPLHGSSPLTQSSWSMADWWCQTAGTPILSTVNPHLLFLPATGHWCVSRFGGIVGAYSTDRHETNPSKIRVHRVGVSNTISLNWRRAASEGRSESALFRPDLTAI